MLLRLPVKIDGIFFALGSVRGEYMILIGVCFCPGTENLKSFNKVLTIFLGAEYFPSVLFPESLRGAESRE